MRIRQLTNHYLLWFFIMILAGCHPKNTPQPDALPANLLATVKHDSVITLPEQIDFSTVSETGLGPQGALIRWTKNNADNPFKVMTYDPQNRLIGTLERFGTHEEIVKARYQGDYLAESFVTDRVVAQSQPLTGLRTLVVRKYKYGAEKRLKQTLRYILWQEGRFKLTESVQYEYDAKGQLELTRYIVRQEGNRFSSTLRYWENGDYTRVEDFPSNASPSVGKRYYNQESDPSTHLNLLLIYPLTEHYVIGSGLLGSTSSPYTTAIDYEYQHDTQGRLVTMRSRNLIPYDSNPWSEWGPLNQFTYAP
ncbi:hypothetical protein BH09BAC4_BH09BAC4_08820 [soil metagenome]